MTHIPSTPTNLYAAIVHLFPSPVALGLQVLPGGRFRPEALGSPAGYAVPPGLRLLRPHAPLSASPPGLSVSSRRVFVLRSDRDGSREVPQFTPRVFLTVPSSVPRQSNGAPTVSSPSALAFTLSVGARHLQTLPRRFSMGSPCSRGCNIHFMLRPGELLALHRQELLLSSFRFSGSPPRSVEYNYPAKQSIAGARLSLARHAALWAASRGHGARRGKKLDTYKDPIFFVMAFGRFYPEINLCALCGEKKGRGWLDLRNEGWLFQ